MLIPDPQNPTTARPTVGPKGGTGTPPKPPHAGFPDAAPIRPGAPPEPPPVNATQRALDHQLYEKCPACNGTRQTTAAMMVDGMVIPDPNGGPARKYSGPLKKGYSPCPLCDPSGMIETGLTALQVERTRARYEMLLRLIVEMHDHHKQADEHGKSPSPAGYLFRYIAEKLDTLPKSDVTAARYDLYRAAKLAAAGLPNG
jgi:hypothetical protein